VTQPHPKLVAALSERKEPIPNCRTRAPRSRLWWLPVSFKNWAW